MLCFGKNSYAEKLIFGPVRLKGRGTESRAAALMPVIYTESISSEAGRGIGCRAAALDPRIAILGFLRLLSEGLRLGIGLDIPFE